MTTLESDQSEVPGHAVELAADAVNGVLATAEDETERAHVVEELNNELLDSGVVIIDVDHDPSERRGKRTNLTREQLIDALAFSRHTNAIRTARALGRRAID